MQAKRIIPPIKSKNSLGSNSILIEPKIANKIKPKTTYKSNLLSLIK